MPSTDTVAVAVAQFAPTGDAAANLREIERLAVVAVNRGARVVVFPEYSSAFVEPFDESLAALAQDLHGPFTAALTQLAARLDLHLVAGLLERGADGRKVRNTVAAVGAAGVVASYRKLHLYDAFGQRESDWVEAGGICDPETFTVSGVRFGLQTCYDLRFPEVTRRIVDAGADAVLVPAEWVRGPLKEHHWRTLLQARAIENTVYVAGADHPPPLGVGNSAVVDPQGLVTAAVGTTTDVAVAHLDPAVLQAVRRTNPVLRQRRFEVVPRA
ncbi:carbon-nitrogen hydrolase family protein [Microbacterium protaetiae]|uniref:Carbon-nitrogen hydrolase family protein n=1 Tax=Microbacterium protaetiae TaxID=2509458 RepID=A0A4P6EHP9_9MICO|nr:carbon-nitrogen hydrolase family protein [Microbacterium protaetiae]QAY61043.1 carbon-nitrogen hydrolase family protein [Microbacterium protaetiae]